MGDAWMRKVWIRKLVVGALAIGSLLGAAPSSAHDARSFDACAARRARAGAPTCGRNVTFLYGDTVFLRGSVEPPHARFEGVVLLKRPSADRWERVDTVPISDAGRMRYVWATDVDDADQMAPYRFRFKIPGHGRSNAVIVWVLFGE